MIKTIADLKLLFKAGEVQTEAKMVDLIDSCYNDGVMPDAYEIVTTMPTTIPLGKLVLYNGTLWRGLKTGESTLAEGTPFPVKGYKECSFSFWYNNPTVIVNVRKNDIKDFTLIRAAAGTYKINDIDFAASNDTEVLVNSGFIQDVSVVTANTENDEVIGNGLSIIIRTNVDNLQIDPESLGVRIFVEVRKYPPTT